MDAVEAEPWQRFRFDPTAEDIQEAWNTINTHQSAIDTIEDDIRGLLDQIQNLRYDQARRRATIARCKGMITLARRLPAELLVKILMHCVEDGWTRAPLVVSQVCSTWRSAANSPKVWSHLYVACDDHDVLDRTRFWLSMARNVELHITITASWRVTRRELDDTMSLLVKYSAQWRSLKLETHEMKHANALLALCQSPMPELRQIDIEVPAFDVDNSEDNLDLTEMPIAFSATNAPRLMVVDYLSGALPAVPVFPLHITHLSVNVARSFARRPLSAALIIACLAPLLALRSLTVRMPLVYEVPFAPEDDPAKVISLPQLSTLTLYGPTDFNGILPHFSTPSLRRLHLRALDGAGFRQLPIGPSLARFLERSGPPPLQLLELHDLNVSPGTFAACFAALDELRELRLHEVAVTDATVALLQGGPQVRALCPRLERLVLRWCGLLNGRALVSLVESRRAPGGSPVQEVAVINCCYVLEEDVLSLARMTRCRIVKDTGDYCSDATCCENGRYRTRLHLKHLSELRGWRESGMRLVL